MPEAQDLRLICYTTETFRDIADFHLFSQLPKELRLKIWRAAILPRILHYGACYGVPVPALLHVNSESRAEGLRSYSLYPTPYGNADLAFRYYNLATDTFFLDLQHPSQLGAVYNSWKRNDFRDEIRHVAIFNTALRERAVSDRSDLPNYAYASIACWEEWNNGLNEGSWESITIVWDRGEAYHFMELEGGLRFVEDKQSRAALRYECDLERPVHAEWRKTHFPSWTKPEARFALLDREE